MSKTHKQIQVLIDVLEDVEDVEDDATSARDGAGHGGAAHASAVDRLGIDIKSLAAGLREKVRAADASDRKARFAAASAAYASELERLAQRKPEPPRSRAEQLGVLAALLAKAPSGQPLAMHFHKYESASDEEIGETIRSLRHLLEEDD
jgi:hypothetical protein